MIAFFIETLFFAICAGLCGSIYKGILSKEPVLNWWFVFGLKFEERWFYPPVWGCVRCISGQMALWSYLLFKLIPSILTQHAPGSQNSGAFLYWYPNGFFLLYGLIIAICGAIFTAMVFSVVIEKVK